MGRGANPAGVGANGFGDDGVWVRRRSVRAFLAQLSAMDRVPQPRHPMLSLWIGVGLVVFGILVNVYAAAEHSRILRRIDARLPFEPPRVSFGPIMAGGIAVAGAAILIYLLRLIG